MTTRLICDGAPETIEHLFFDCPFSKVCLNEILIWLGISLQLRDVKGI